tara:strand:+ start:605 stop:799 length:195 start_codon:yes stop_codon:yes gene_type:complete
MFTRSYVSTLFIIQIDVVRKQFYIFVSNIRSPINAELYIMVIEGYQREGRLWRFTEKKPKRVKK